MKRKGYKKDPELTNLKHRNILKEYFRIINMHGKLARRMSKESLYEEAGAPFYVGAIHAGRIIRGLIENNKPLVLEVEREVIAEVNA